MTAEAKEPFEKISRDKNVRQALMVECVTEALQKKKRWKLFAFVSKLGQCYR